MLSVTIVLRTSCGHLTTVAALSRATSRGSNIVYDVHIHFQLQCVTSLKAVRNGDKNDLGNTNDRSYFLDDRVDPKYPRTFYVMVVIQLIDDRECSRSSTQRKPSGRPKAVISLNLVELNFMPDTFGAWVAN